MGNRKVKQEEVEPEEWEIMDAGTWVLQAHAGQVGAKLLDL